MDVRSARRAIGAPALVLAGEPPAQCRARRKTGVIAADLVVDFELGVREGGAEAKPEAVGGWPAVACTTAKSWGQIDVVSTDEAVAPLTEHNYLGDPDGHDIAVLREGLMMAKATLASPALASIPGALVTDTSSDAGIRRTVAHDYHPVGTCMMGDGPLAVCDARGAVHGLSCVTIGDA